MLRRASILSVCLTIICCQIVSAQGMGISKEEVEYLRRINWLRIHAGEIRSDDFEDTDWSDLASLKEAIGDRRIVLLGEADHGNGSIFSMKCRLIRFLHEEMGFNVLAWESGLTCCHDMDNAFVNDIGTLQERIDLGVFFIWGGAQETHDLFNYIADNRNGAHPLILAGFDCQFSSDSCRTAFITDIEHFFNAGSETLLNSDRLSRLESFVNNLRSLSTSEAEGFVALTDAIYGLYNSYRETLAAVHTEKEMLFWNRALLNLQSEAQNALARANEDDQSWVIGNTRDKAMADSLIFLAKEYFPNEKIIVWAASYHNMRNMHLLDTQVEGFTYDQTMVMGHLLWQEFGDELYNVAFVYNEGYTSYVNGSYSAALEPALEGMLAWYLNKLGGDSYFFDITGLVDRNWLKSGNSEVRFLGRSPMRTKDWSRIFDGVIYVREIKPATRIAN